MDRQADGQTDGQTDRQTDGRTDRQTDRQTECINTFQLCWKVLKRELKKIIIINKCMKFDQALKSNG